MTARRRHRDRGQAAVEVALAMPLVVVVMLAVVQLVVVISESLAVQLAAREAARAASVSAQPDAAARAAASRSVGLQPMRISVNVGNGTVTASVAYVSPTDVPLIGALIPSVALRSSVTMALEPPPP
jgi:Flp pilus assembly protein TadG